MKIERGSGVSQTSSARKAGAAAAPGFAPAAEAPQRAAPVTGVGAIPSLDAILALQGEEGPAQRRARQARRGRAALDALEALEKGLVLGRAPAGLRAELEALRRDAQPSGDEGLDEVLREIDTRLAVELAKLEVGGVR
ncbi:MAG: flagellar assembly protein FliX [Hyphomonadaceae bacterium]